MKSLDFSFFQGSASFFVYAACSGLAISYLINTSSFVIYLVAIQQQQQMQTKHNSRIKTPPLSPITMIIHSVNILAIKNS